MPPPRRARAARRGAHRRHLDVGPFGPADVQALTAAATGSRIPGLMAHRLCAHTLGNPATCLRCWPRPRRPLAGLGVRAARTPGVQPDHRPPLAACSDDARLLVEAAAALGDDAL